MARTGLALCIHFCIGGHVSRDLARSERQKVIDTSKKLFPRRCAVVSQMNMNNSLVRFLSLVKHKQSFSLSLSHSYAPPPQYDFRNSEAPSHTGVKQQGGRLKEASNINQSLSVLGNVIMALAETSEGKVQHPFTPSDTIPTLCDTTHYTQPV